MIAKASAISINRITQGKLQHEDMQEFGIKDSDREYAGKSMGWYVQHARRHGAAQWVRVGHSKCAGTSCTSTWAA